MSNEPRKPLFHILGLTALYNRFQTPGYVAKNPVGFLGTPT